MLGEEVARRLEARVGEAAVVAEDAVGLGQEVQALLGRDAGQVADGEGPVGLLLPRRAVPVQVDADGHGVDASAVEAEVGGHEVGVVVARRHEGVHRSRVPADQLLRLRPVPVAEAFQEEVLALERADDGSLQLPAQGRGQADEERVGDDREVEGRQVVEILEQLPELLGLVSFLAPERGDRQRAEGVGDRRRCRARSPPGSPAPRPTAGRGRPGSCETAAGSARGRR